MRILRVLLAAILISGSLPGFAAWRPAQRIDAYLDALAKQELANLPPPEDDSTGAGTPPPADDVPVDHLGGVV